MLCRRVIVRPFAFLCGVSPRHYVNSLAVFTYGRDRFHPAFCPEPLCDWQRFDIEIVPPCDFIARSMQLVMVIAAERHRELVADFETQRSRLRET